MIGGWSWPPSTRKLSAILAVVVILLATIACRQPATEVSGPADDWVVEVYQSGSIVGAGCVIGDGNQVLTVFDYGTDIPAGLEVGSGEGVRYPARIVAFDPRTGATLLELEDAHLPVGTPGDARDVGKGQSVVVQGWLLSPSAIVKDGSGTVILSAETGMGRTLAKTGSPYGTPLRFRMSYSSLPYSMVASPLPGTVITDTSGNILGLVGNLTWSPGYLRTAIGAIPPVVGINSFLELLSDDFSQRPEANGPTGYSVYASTSGASGYLDLPDNYQAVADAVRTLLGELGEPIASDYLYETYLRHGHDPRGGKLMVLNYALPVELRNQNGELLAQAKRIKIAWNRPYGEPDVVYYTDDESDVQKGFTLPGGGGVLSAIQIPSGQ